MSLLTGARSSSLGNRFWISFTVFRLFCYCHFVIKSRATCRPKSRCQSDLSTVSVLTKRRLHQNLMHSGCLGTAVPNVCLQAFSLFPPPVPRSTKGLFTGCHPSRSQERSAERAIRKKILPRTEYPWRFCRVQQETPVPSQPCLVWRDFFESPSRRLLASLILPHRKAVFKIDLYKGS